jgi:hypothetical protein
MEKKIIYDPDKLARACRMVIAGNMITQGELSKQTGIPRQKLNEFLRRKINLLESDTEKLIKALDLETFRPQLSAPCDMNLDLFLTGEDY